MSLTFSLPRNSCQGDSGGPLITSAGVQVGIVSFVSAPLGRKDVADVKLMLSLGTESVKHSFAFVHTSPRGLVVLV